MPTKDFVHVDPADANYAEICSHAARVEALLADPALQTDADVVAPLDLFVGALYGLATARRLDYQDRVGRSPATAPIRELARQLGTGNLRSDGVWLAGFSFNNALARMAGVYHRLLKVTTSRRASSDHRPVLVPLAETAYQGWTGKQWRHTAADLVYVEINDLKHTTDGLHATRHVLFTDAVDAAGEILNLVEAWNKAGRP